MLKFFVFQQQTVGAPVVTDLRVYIAHKQCVGCCVVTGLPVGSVVGGIDMVISFILDLNMRSLYCSWEKGGRSNVTFQ